MLIVSNFVRIVLFFSHANKYRLEQMILIIISYSHFCFLFHETIFDSHNININPIIFLDPDDGLLAQFIHADADPLVRATQVLAIISYSLFAESSLQDVITGKIILVIIYFVTSPVRWCI